jgi:hypothetical protein
MPVLDARDEPESPTAGAVVGPAARAEPKPARRGDAAPNGVPPGAAAEIVYERQPVAAVPRRWLLAIVLLLMLNVVATTSITWGPVVMQSARQALAERRAAAAAAQAKAAVAAVEVAKRQRDEALRAQAAVFVIPAGTVVYTEDLAEAARLLNDPAGGYSSVSGGNPVDPGVRLPHPPVRRDDPPELKQMIRSLGQAPRGATALLHERRSPSGRRLFDWVALQADLDVDSAPDGDGGRYTHVGADRRLVTWVVDPAATTDSRPWRHALTFDQPVDRMATVHARPGGLVSKSHPDQVVKEAAEPMRFLAGRVDPKDPSRFEIDYTLGGRPGTIDGWVYDDGRARVVPRVGAHTLSWIDTQGVQRWDPYAPAPPAE